jgi:hypothetical protein
MRLIAEGLAARGTCRDLRLAAPDALPLAKTSLRTGSRSGSGLARAVAARLTRRLA